MSTTVDTTDAGLIAAFSDYQRGRGWSANTVNRRRSTLGMLARDLGQVAQSEPPADVFNSEHLLAAQEDDLEQWLGKFPTARTRHAYRSDLRTFYRWAIRRRLIERNPADILDPIKVPKNLPRPLHGDLEGLTLVGRPEVRRMVALGLYAGLRCAEIAALDGSDIEFDAEPPILVVRDGKGGKDRVIPLHPALVELLRDVPASGPVFPNKATGRPVRAKSVSAAIGRHLERCCFTGTAHALRHTFGTNLARATGGDVVLVGGLMGHSSPSTTMGYVEYCNTGAAEAVAKMYA